MNMLRHSLHYRRESFSAGLKNAGFEVVDHLATPRPGDLLLVWNLYGGYYEQAQFFKSCGATVVVTENGWLGKNWLGKDWFSLSLNHHVGAGDWNHEGPQRWDSFGVALQPWRQGKGETIVLGQRGIGERGYASPNRWAERTRAQLGCGRIREHPGNVAHGATTPTLERDLSKATDVVTWASGAALLALMMGIPVWCALPQWIGASAGLPLSEFSPGNGKRDDAARLEMFRRMAWAMWTLEEIRTGEPFLRLLR
jgi:hypothetical protein